MPSARRDTKFNVMKLHYLGTGAAEGIPALFCNCEYCRSVKERGGREVRSRSQIIIDGDLSIDFPPDAFLHGVKAGVDLSAIKYLLVTHSHMDHFYAHDFILRGYKYGRNLTSPTLTIFGNAEVKEVFNECTRRELRADVKGGIEVVTVNSFEEFSFGTYVAVPLKASHTSENPFVYLVQKNGKRYLHLTDTGRLPEEDYRYLSALGGYVDAITFDCTFLWEKSDAVRRHMGLDDVKEVRERLHSIGVADEKTKCILTHFSHNAEPTMGSLSRAEKEYGVQAAYDGMTLEV